MGLVLRLQDAGVAAEPLAAGRAQEVDTQLEAQGDLALADEAGPDPGVDEAVLLQVPRPDLEEARALPGAEGLELHPELGVDRRLETVQVWWGLRGVGLPGLRPGMSAVTPGARRPRENPCPRRR